MNIFVTFRGFSVVYNNLCCVASPQSKSHNSFFSANKSSTTAVTLRFFDGIPAPVPKKVTFINILPTISYLYSISFLNLFNENLKVYQMNFVNKHLTEYYSYGCNRWL